MSDGTAKAGFSNTFWIVFGAAVVVFAALFFNFDRAGAPEAAQPSATGRALYETNCAVCHGSDGDGNGPAAHMFVVRPRDFRPGIFKFRSTPNGSLPTDADLLRTLADGVRWTGMLGRDDLSLADRRALVDYVKTFSTRFAGEKPAPAVVIPPPPPTSPKLVAEGKNLFRDADCVSCHGANGRGDGPSGKDLKDDWGQPIRPSDLTWRPLKRGSALESIYLTIATGLAGTPMASYGDALSSDQIWALVYYLESIVPPERRVPPRQWLGEEQQGQRALHMGGMMGRGMMRGRR